MKAFLFFAALCTGCAAQPSAPPIAPTAPICATTAADPLPKTYDELNDEQLARKLMEVTGAGNLGVQLMDSMLDGFRKMPNVSPAFLDEFRKRAKPEDLVDRIVPVYLKHYDRATMLAALRFYESDAGKTMISKLPAVTAESTEVGRAWGKDLATDVLRSMQRP